MLHIGTQSGRDNYVRHVPCEWKGKVCTQAHLLRDCPMFMKKKPRERMQHIQMSRRCFNCMRKNHMSKDCKSPIPCTAEGCTARHNVCLHDAWQEKKNEVALLTKTVSPIALLTTPVIISTDTSPLMFETNAIHDNGASVSL
jgi:hypothetical protein